MRATLRAWSDRLLGRGDASITVPVFDGALKSNRLLDDATVLATLKAPADLATDGMSVFVADGGCIWQHDVGNLDWAPTVAAQVEGVITALACLPAGGLALAVDGREIRIVGGAHHGRRYTSVAGRALNAVNAISALADGRLIATDGSATQPPERWKHDLMGLGRSGRLVEFSPGAESGRELIGDLAYSFGACETPTGNWVCESWRYRVLSVGAGAAVPVVDNLPGYPSRIVAAAGGGYWLTCFALRTQLVEFVLREPEFRKRMLKEVDPRYWIAPSVNSGNTFLEPMQGAHLKMMGVVKPWAPPRSYGLVVRLTDEGLIRYSLHSRFDGQNHGVVAAVECAGQLYLLSLGRNRLLRLSIADAERSLAA